MLPTTTSISTWLHVQEEIVYVPVKIVKIQVEIKGGGSKAAGMPTKLEVPKIIIKEKTTTRRRLERAEFKKYKMDKELEEELEFIRLEDEFERRFVEGELLEEQLKQLEKDEVEHEQLQQEQQAQENQQELELEW